MVGPRHPLLVLLSAIAAIQGIGLIGYALYDVVQGITVGITGPQEVSNLPALVLQIVIFAALGTGLMLVARGWWRARYGARAPFIVAQLLALVVGVPLMSAPDAWTRQVGVALIVVGVAGLVLALLPAVTRIIVQEGDGD